jgi:uncharacterized protein YndB with AHSA1/START domain
MKNSETLKIFPVGEKELVITRVFNAPHEMVFDAFTKPVLLKKWLLGPPGWTMPTCSVELKIGGTYRYVWRNEEGEELGVGGAFQEIVKPTKLVHTEKFDEAWYPGESVITTVLKDQGGKTLLTGTILYETKEARDMVLKSNMEEGVGLSYDNLEDILHKSQH